MTYWEKYRRWHRAHPDKPLFRMKIEPAVQWEFIRLWHRNVIMSVSQLSRMAGISRPTAYRILGLLKRRGDVRGERYDV